MQGKVLEYQARDTFLKISRDFNMRLILQSIASLETMLAGSVER